MAEHAAGAEGVSRELAITRHLADVVLCLSPATLLRARLVYAPAERETLLHVDLKAAPGRVSLIGTHAQLLTLGERLRQLADELDADPRTTEGAPREAQHTLEATDGHEGTRDRRDRS